MELKNLSMREIWSRKNSINNSWNFAIGNIKDSDKKLFFQLLDGEHFEVIPLEETIWNILINIGVFTNNAQCKGANIPKQIPEGFTSFAIGKRKEWISILKIIQ
jgi:hypothetical protein